MKSKNILTLTFAFLSLMTFGQRSVMELTFTAVNINSHVQLDSVKIMNRTQGGDTVLYYPDTVLVLYFTGIPEPQPLTSDFMVFQNYPNPMTDQTTISLYVPEKDRVSIIVTDLLGRETLKSERVLDRGNHYFRFSPGSSNLYFFTAQWKGRSSSIKILQASSGLNSTCSLDYIGSHVSTSQLKTSEDIFDFTYSDGDELLYIGYSNTLQSGISDIPEESEIFTFQFATNIPCPGTPIVEYAGQIYNTIQIFSQCWLKENLNIGNRIYTYLDQSDNGIIEKYCYNGVEDSCDKYGGIYQWKEVMQYTLQEGTQGICPQGWHLPTDEDWKILEGVADSQYGIGDPIWEWSGYRGFNAGTNLKTNSGWRYNGNGTDLLGFSAMPGGKCYLNGIFNQSAGLTGFWWTSTPEDYNVGYFHSLEYWVNGSGSDYCFSRYGLSVRCLKGDVYEDPIELFFSAINNFSHVQLDSVRVINLTTQGFEKMLNWPDTSLLLGYELLFNDGDELMLIGYMNDLETARIIYPVKNDTITFQFAVNISCPGTPTVTYGGKEYNTIQIFSQCWLQENLNIGTMIPGHQDMSDNNILEKYCFNDEPDSCEKYGGLYQWNEIMQYTAQQGTQGICPPGWHLPMDQEWKILEGSVDSLYKIFNPEWDLATGFRGYDAGSKLKSSFGWFDNGNGTDLFGFSGLPSGIRDYDGSFIRNTNYGTWWTSSEFSYSQAWSRLLYYDDSKIFRYDWDFCGEYYGFSVRCLRDE